MLISSNTTVLVCACLSDNEDAKSATTDGESADEEEGGGVSAVRQHVDRYGVGGINRPVAKPQNRSHYSYAPIHIAIQHGHKVHMCAIKLDIF